DAGGAVDQPGPGADRHRGRCHHGEGGHRTDRAQQGHGVPRGEAARRGRRGSPRRRRHPDRRSGGGGFGMKLGVHALTAAAMAGPAAALGLWRGPWWLGVLVAVVVDGVWLLAGRMEAVLTAAALDARRPKAVAWAVAALSAALLLVHALVEGSVAWGV